MALLYQLQRILGWLARSWLLCSLWELPTRVAPRLQVLLRGRLILEENNPRVLSLLGGLDGPHTLSQWACYHILAALWLRSYLSRAPNIEALHASDGDRLPPGPNFLICLWIQVLYFIEVLWQRWRALRLSWRLRAGQRAGIRHHLHLLEQAHVRCLDLQHQLIATLPQAKESIEDPAAACLSLSRMLQMRQIHVSASLCLACIAQASVNPLDFFAGTSELLASNILQDWISTWRPLLLGGVIGSSSTS